MARRARDGAGPSRRQRQMARGPSMRVLGSIREDEAGATSVEYALLISLIATVIAGAVAVVGQQVLGFFTGFTGSVNW
jgi:Flp pilus assembly pilin Flp